MRHDQKPRESKMVCLACREYECDKCIDLQRAKVFTDPPKLCVCNHATFAEIVAP